MENNKVVPKRKVGHNRKKILYSILAGILAIIIIATIPRYSHYKKGQELAVASMLLVMPDKFEECNTDSVNAELVDAMYHYLVEARYLSGLYTLGDHSEEDVALGDLLNDLGYDCRRGSEYLASTNFFEFFITDNVGILIGYMLSCTLIVTINTLFIKEKKKTDIQIKEKPMDFKNEELEQNRIER